MDGASDLEVPLHHSFILSGLSDLRCIRRAAYEPQGWATATAIRRLLDIPYRVRLVEHPCRGARVNAEAPVQRQLDAYNAHDIERFVAEYADDVVVFRPPAAAPVLSGKQAFAEHYAKNRFTIANLHATVVNRMVAGNMVVDHERIVGLEAEVVEAIAVYEIEGALIKKVWFF